MLEVDNEQAILISLLGLDADTATSRPTDGQWSCEIDTKVCIGSNCPNQIAVRSRRAAPICDESISRIRLCEEIEAIKERRSGIAIIKFVFCGKRSRSESSEKGADLQNE